MIGGSGSSLLSARGSSSVFCSLRRPPRQAASSQRSGQLSQDPLPHGRGLRLSRTSYTGEVADKSAEQRLTAIEGYLETFGSKLLELVNANNQNALAVNELTMDVKGLSGDVRLLANKIDQFVDAAFERRGNGKDTE